MTATETISIPVNGMTCGGCVRHVERALLGTPGVEKAAVDLRGKRASVTYDPSRVGPDALAASVEAAGYEVPREG